MHTITSSSTIASINMVEVFKTNVLHMEHAQKLCHEIHRHFTNYSATFDLSDCDKILRVENIKGKVYPSGIITLLQTHGFMAEALLDEI